MPHLYWGSFPEKVQLSYEKLSEKGGLAGFALTILLRFFRGSGAAAQKWNGIFGWPAGPQSPAANVSDCLLERSATRASYRRHRTRSVIWPCGHRTLQQPYILTNGRAMGGGVVMLALPLIHLPKTLARTEQAHLGSGLGAAEHRGDFLQTVPKAGV